MYIESKKLKEFITDAGLVSVKDLEMAEAEAMRRGEDLGHVLVSQGKINDEDLTRMKAYISGIPFVNLKGQKINFRQLPSG